MHLSSRVYLAPGSDTMRRFVHSFSIQLAKRRLAEGAFDSAARTYLELS